MKLFQIEEPDGTPVDDDATGAAVGIDLTSREVAVAVGGNAELLPAQEGEAVEGETASLLLALRSRAEKRLARPVTHAVIVTAPSADLAAIEAAAASAGMAVLRTVTRAARDVAPVMGAAILAEDLAPVSGE